MEFLNSLKVRQSLSKSMTRTISCMLGIKLTARELEFDLSTS